MKNMHDLLSRRQLLALVGRAAGGAAMYQAMNTLGFAASSAYSGRIKLDGAPKGTKILILGAGMAGLVAAYELRNAGYSVKVLEYNNRAGGRAWTIRGGDEYTELGGATQRCEFDSGLYINPGPWRIPYNHHAVLDYAKRLNVPLEPFVQVNYNAYLHSSRAFDGKPQRYRQVQTDYQGCWFALPKGLFGTASTPICDSWSSMNSTPSGLPQGLTAVGSGRDSSAKTL